MKTAFRSRGPVQSAGDAEHAAVEYKAFLSAALHRVANGQAGAGQFDPAMALFDEALKLRPRTRIFSWTTRVWRLTPRNSRARKS